MSFIRPEAQATLWRWREVMAGTVIAVLGLSWALGAGGLLGWLGWALSAAGLALLVVGLQRMRFGQGSGGPGVVAIDEGQIAYFGPLGGGQVALSELHRLTLDPTAHPAHWILAQPGQPQLSIPVTAQGAEALFDAFSALPGLRTK